jgi:hypothetical protein
MRAKEFISEDAAAKTHGKFTNLGNEVGDALPGVWVQRQLRNTDPYMQYRYGLAMAAARADANGHIEFNQESPWAENLTIVGFSTEDDETVKLADKMMGVKGTLIANSKSKEAPGANTVSPVANWMKTK